MGKLICIFESHYSEERATKWRGIESLSDAIPAIANSMLYSGLLVFE